MKMFQSSNDQGQLQMISGVVERVTYHNVENGWTVLKVKTFRDPHKLLAVVLHQQKVFAGATMDFYGKFSMHPKHGEQFIVEKAVEKKPATVAALEKYIGSGLIKGVGPQFAKRIVKHFKEKTLEVFEGNIDSLTEVRGISEKKLDAIKISWDEHRSIREVMLFLQNFQVSTLFATKIYKQYGNKALKILEENPYQMAKDIYGVGFFSADTIALKIGISPLSEKRLMAGVRHVLASSREEGHCYLTYSQIYAQLQELLRLEISEDLFQKNLQILKDENQIKIRETIQDGQVVHLYYSKSLYFDEIKVSEHLMNFFRHEWPVDLSRVDVWMEKYREKHSVLLSDEQFLAIKSIIQSPVSILTGGPGCGKTTTTKVLVQLLLAMKRRVVLAAPTGRAAQRMGEVIGLPAKTIHRLLEWAPNANAFKHNEENPLLGDFFIFDECSMLDISLSHSLLSAVPKKAQVLFIGDPDQLPSVGAGNVLQDMINSNKIFVARLTQIFRQGKDSSIITFAHQINKGETPKVLSFAKHKTDVVAKKTDCVFLESDVATVEQLKFIKKVKMHFQNSEAIDESSSLDEKVEEFVLPKKFEHVNVDQLLKHETQTDELKEVIKKIHPQSSLHYGLSAEDCLLRLFESTIPEIFGRTCEVQILCPQVRGSMGTMNLNRIIQEKINPKTPMHTKEFVFGEKILRLKDRVIQTRNNYDLEVFNGDIGMIVDIDFENESLSVKFPSKDIPVVYQKDDMIDLMLSYAITIHKSQGSEFPVVIIPIFSQHYNMLFRNLIYTGLTRAKQCAIFLGNRKAFHLGIQKIDNRIRQTYLKELLALK